MKEGFGEIINLVVGRYILGGIGYVIRKSIQWTRKKLRIKLKKKGESWDFDKVIDIEDFKNRIVGFAFVLFVIILLLICHR